MSEIQEILTPQTLPAVVEQATTELKGFQDRVDAAKEKYLTLKIETHTDKAVYDEVTTGLRRFVKTRTTIEAKRKEYTAPLVKAQKEINALAKGVIEQLAPVELHLKAQKERYENLKEQERKRAYLAKIRMVTEAGALYDGVMYVAGPFAVHPNELMDLSEAEVEAKAAEIQQWVELDKQRKAKEEAERKAELARLEHLRKEAEEREAAAKAVEPEAPEIPQQQVFSQYGSEEPQANAPRFTPPNLRQPRPQPEIPAGNVAVTTADYANGFKDAQNQVIALFGGGVKRTRGEFIELINALKPSRK